MHQYVNSWHFYLMSQQEVEGPRWERKKEGNEERTVIAGNRVKNSVEMESRIYKAAKKKESKKDKTR